MPTLTSTIDWISGTFTLPEQAIRFITWLEPENRFKDEKPRFGYEYGAVYPSGMIVYGSTKRAEMGTHVILSGSTLAYYIKSGIAVLAILEKFFTNRGKCTRLDLAIDIIDGSINEKEIYEAIQSGDRAGIASSSSLVLSDKGGRTLYIGSRQSERFMRVYDKGAEQGIDMDWHRLEIECKGDVAKEYVRTLAMDGTLGLGSFTWSIASRLLTTKGGGYHMFGANSDTVALPKIEKTSDTKKWIISQVIPALTNYLKDTHDREVIAEIAELLYNVENNHTWAKALDE